MRTLFTTFLLLVFVSPAFAHEEPCDCGCVKGVGGKPVQLIVGNEKGETITFTPDEFAALEQTTIEVPEKDGTKTTYQGVPVGKLLTLAGVDFGGLCRKPKAGPPLLAHYVLVDAADGYQTAFSLLEVNPKADGDPVLVAFRKNGEPLESKGPYMIIDTTSGIHGRWVRQTARILLRPIGGSTAHVHDESATGDETLQGPGGLFLVGMGPGNPELLTLRARDILRHADRVYCFNWLKEEVSAFVPADKVVVASPYLRGGRYLDLNPSDFEGKQREQVEKGNAALEEFGKEVRQLVGEGKTVAIVAAGDPTIYCPWGWIPEHLAELNPTVVPGISSFNASNAALKHGAVGASYFMLSAGHDLAACDEQGRLSGVLVLFTHTAKLPEQVATLKKTYPEDTPIAIVCDASHPTERIIRGTLTTILDELGSGKLPHLYLIYVGDGLDRKHNTP